MNTDNILAEKLLKIKAIKLQPSDPFTWASGWKSPFYCDNRKALSYPSLRSFVKIELSRIVAEKYPDAEVVAGVQQEPLHKEHLWQIFSDYPLFTFAQRQKTTD